MTLTPLRTADQTELYVQRWEVPPGTERTGSLLLVHGLGEHSGRYAHVAQAVTGLGLEVWSYDHRGHGRSGGNRGAIPGPDTLLEDLDGVFAELSANASAAGDTTVPFLLGHSMGGGIVARAVTGGRIRPRGLILSSPALRLRVNPVQRTAVRVLTRLAPDRAMPNGLKVEGLSHDPDVIADYQSDEHNHDRITPRLTQFMLNAGAQAIADAPSLHVPTLLLIGGADPIVDPSGARDFADALPEGVGTLHWYDELLHEIFNEREPDRSRVLEDLRSWLRSQL